MESTIDRTASDTIDLLEARLQRIQYVIFGQGTHDAVNNNKRSASVRLRELEHALNQLISNSRVMQDLVKLRKYSRAILQPMQPKLMAHR